MNLPDLVADFGASAPVHPVILRGNINTTAGHNETVRHSETAFSRGDTI